MDKTSPPWRPEQACRTLPSHHSKDRYLQVQFLPPDHQTLEPVATLNNKCTYCTDIQHFGPASYHQSSNWAVNGLSSCSDWSTSQLVQHQPVFTCTSREILCCHSDLVVGVYSLLFVLHVCDVAQLGEIPVLVYQELHWLPVKERILFKTVLLVYRCLNNPTPIYLTELLQIYIPSDNLRSGLDQPRLVSNRTSTMFGDCAPNCAFQNAAPRVWNNLPVAVRRSATIASFKKQTKTHLFLE